MLITKAFAQTEAGEAADNAAETVGEETHSEVGTAGEAGHEGAFPPFNSETFASQLLWLAITFGLLYFIMSRVVLPRISGILEVRRDRISRDLDEAQRLQDESDAALAAYEQELAEAKNRAHKIAQEARDQAKEEADAEREKVEAELDEKLAGAEKQIAKIKSKALAEVDDIATETAVSIVKELIGGTVSKAEISKAVAAVPR